MASQSVLRLWNQAVSALGVTNTIGAEDEVSLEARQCTLWYETVRDAVFRAAPWASLTGYSRLALNAERDTDEDWVATDPPPGWLYAFSQPAHMARPRALASGAQFIVSNVGNSRVIVCNEETPILFYTRDDINITNWDVDLFHAVVYGLAAHIARGLTGNDADVRTNFQLAVEKILIARVNNANQQNVQAEPIPDWLAARGTNLSMPTSRYVYPSADFTIMGSNPLG
jgi:hypothetical protein